MGTPFDKKIDRLGTFCTQWDFIEDRFGRKDLLPFSISDMDFQSPDVIINNLQNRLTHGVFGYTRWNHDAYKSRIVDWYQKRFETFVDSEHIVYSPSVCYSISKIIEILTFEDDHVVINTPAYDAFFKLIKRNKRQCIESDLIEENGCFTIDFVDLERKLAHPKAKVFLLCSPHNPTGRVWTSAELERLLELCQKHEVFFISDEIHMDILRKGMEHTPITKLAKNLDNVCICTSASKTFNTAGLNGSYAIIPNSWLKEQFLIQLKEKDNLSSASIFGINALMNGYQYADSWVDELNDYLEGNLHYLKDFLAEYFPKVQFQIPQATFLAWIDVSSFELTDNEIQKALIELGKVAIMRGDTYGKAGERYLRLNVGCSREKLAEGLNRLKIAMEEVLELTV